MFKLQGVSFPIYLLLVSLYLCLTPAFAANRFFSLVLDSFQPDGFPRKLARINGTAPGPVLRFTENDVVTITVHNQFSVGATVHWHGIFQHGTPYSDGVPGVTQCAIPANGQLTYTFVATPPGTHFYHAHYQLQIVDGLFGAMIIDPLVVPESSPKADAEVVMVVHDWYNLPALTLASWFLSPASGGNEPNPDAIAVNGQFGIVKPFLTFYQQRHSTLRIRIINAAAFSMYNFTIDSLPLNVMELDGTLTELLPVPYVMLNAAQRVSLFVNFSALDNTLLKGENSIYWRFHAMISMYPVDPTTNLPPYEPNPYPYLPPAYFVPEFHGVFAFDNTLPDTIPSYDVNDLKYQIIPNMVADPHQETNLVLARPLIPERAPDATHQLYMEIEFFADDQGVNHGHFNNIAYLDEDAKPILHDLIKGNPLKVPLNKPVNGQIQGNANSQYYIPGGAVVDMLLNNTDTGEHPFHLHGQTFYVLASSDFPEAETLYRDNYIRRDIVSVPLLGWAKIRIVANNPGSWAFHCHIDWHMASGLFATMVTNPEALANNSSYIIPQQNLDICNTPSRK